MSPCTSLCVGWIAYVFANSHSCHCEQLSHSLRVFTVSVTDRLLESGWFTFPKMPQWNGFPCCQLRSVLLHPTTSLLFSQQKIMKVCRKWGLNGSYRGSSQEHLFNFVLQTTYIDVRVSARSESLLPHSECACFSQGSTLSTFSRFNVPCLSAGIHFTTALQTEKRSLMNRKGTKILSVSL